MPKARRQRSSGACLARAALGAAALALGLSLAQGQCVWRAFRAGDGLAEAICRTVSVGSGGAVGVTHPGAWAVTILDGYRVRNLPSPADGLDRVWECADGTVWGLAGLKLWRMESGAWRPFDLSPLLQDHGIGAGEGRGAARALPLNCDQALLVLQRLILVFRADAPLHPRAAADAQALGLGRFTGAAFAPDGSVWVAAAEGLLRFPPGAFESDKKPPQPEVVRPPESFPVREFQRPLPDPQGGAAVTGWLRDKSRRVAAHWDGARWSWRGVPGENVRYAWSGPSGGALWAATFATLFRLTDVGAEEVNEQPLAAGPFYDAARDLEGGLWLATHSGLVRIAPAIWRVPAGGRFPADAAYDAAWDAEGRMWLATPRGLVQAATGQIFPWPAGARAVWRPGDGLWAAEGRELLFRAGVGVWRFEVSNGRMERAQSAAGGRPVAVLGPGGAEGIYLLIEADSAKDGRFRIARYARGRAIPTGMPPLPPEAGAARSLFRDGAGEIWVGADAGPMRLEGGRWRLFGRGDGFKDRGAYCFARPGNGRLWCGGGSMVSEFDGRRWRTMESYLDGVWRLTRGRGGVVWAATGSGLYRIDPEQKSWALNGLEEGLPSLLVYTARVAPDGAVWAGTARGAARRYPEADRAPPFAAKAEWETMARRGGLFTVRLRFRGRDKWRYTQDRRLLYSYRIDGGTWSPFFPRDYALAARLGAGEHVAEVRAMDRNGNVQPAPSGAAFALLLPWYRDPRLVAVALAAAAGVLVSFGVALNRHFRLRRSYAEVERLVEERTEKLRQAMEALAHTRKMTALGALAAGVAHDFNNILSVIKGSAQLLKQRLDDPERARAQAERIETAVDQAEAVVRALLGFSRVRRERVVRTDPCALAKGALRLLPRRLCREMKVKVECDPQAPAAETAPELAQQILLNLLLNAAEAMGGGGEARLTVRKLDAPPEGAILAPKEAPAYAAVCVEDQGVGIDPEILPRIFEPFFTTKAFSSRRGAGLGLYMVYEIAREIGAGLHVASTPGKGSRFTLILPAAREES